MKRIFKRNIFLLLFSLLSTVPSFSQINVKDSLLFSFLKVSYAFQLPGGDLAKRFGYNSNLGLAFSHKTKRNFIFGASGYFLFGNQTKENGILDSLETSKSTGTGFIINQNGNAATVRLFERAFNFSVYIGKIFHAFAPNSNSGILIYGGPTYLLHKIAIQDIGHQSPQLVSPYTKGYDRLSDGFGLQEFIGYEYFGNRRILNFFGGFEFTQAITKSLRGYDYDLRQPDTALQTDFLFGFRIGWIFPLYKKVPQKFYYD